MEDNTLPEFTMDTYVPVWNGTGWDIKMIEKPYMDGDGQLCFLFGDGSRMTQEEMLGHLYADRDGRLTDALVQCLMTMVMKEREKKTNLEGSEG